MSKADNLLPGFQSHQITNNLKLWCDPSHLSLLTSATIIDALHNSESHITQPNIHLLKLGRRRHVIRIKSNDDLFVIKSFPFTRLREKLKYKKYGLSEIRNNKKARQLEIPSPHYYAYFESRKSGLVNTCGCITNFLDNHKPLEGSSRSDIEILKSAILPLTNLFKKGVNHIDISPANIFIGTQDFDYCIIDWQYCSFLQPNDPLQLAVHAAHFLKQLKNDIGQDVVKNWLEELYIFAQPKISKNNFISAVILLQNQKLSIKDRLGLNFDRDRLFKE